MRKANAYLAALLATGITVSLPTNAKAEEVGMHNYASRISFNQELDENEYMNYTSFLSDNEINVFVNEDIYKNMKKAKTKFDKMFENGIVTNQMKNRGININEEEANYINAYLYNTYGVIAQYVESYEEKDVNACYELGTILYDSYHNGACSKDYLYDVLVRRNLPEGYQGRFALDRYGNGYDLAGNILLDNGNYIRCIGLDDDLVCQDSYDDNQYNEMVNRSKWFVELPNIISSHYSVINNDLGDNVCYIWNDTKVERCVDKEWSAIKEEDASIYGFDADSTRIIYDNNYDSYFYVDSDDFVCGELDYEQSNRVDRIFYVQDSLISNEGDPLLLDSYIKDMNKHEKEVSKNR